MALEPWPKEEYPIEEKEPKKGPEEEPKKGPEEESKEADLVKGPEETYVDVDEEAKPAEKKPEEETSVNEAAKSAEKKPEEEKPKEEVTNVKPPKRKALFRKPVNVEMEKARAARKLKHKEIKMGRRGSNYDTKGKNRKNKNPLISVVAATCLFKLVFIFWLGASGSLWRR